jgi:hypothetical protein
MTWFQAHQTLLAWLGAMSILMFVGTLIVIPLIVIALPVDYLAVDERRVGFEPHPLWHIPYLLLKNLVGGLFVATGLVMLVLPGQGILTILIGLGLVDFPGKRRLIRSLMGRRRVFLTINRLRARAGKSPLTPPEEDT